MRLRDFWRDLPPWAKRSFWGSILFGFICLAGGLYGDVRGLWDSWSYGSNMFTSLTGALFGVPFAAIFITWFTASLESRVSRTGAETAAKALTISAWSEIKELTEAHIGIIDPSALRENAKAVAEQLEKAKKIAVPVLDRNLWALTQGADSDFKWATERSNEQFAEDIQALLQVVQSLKAPWKVLRAPAEHAQTLNQNWAALRGKWQFLSNTVKAQRLSAGLGWGMPEGPDSQFALHFAAEMSPLNRALATIYSRASEVVQALVEALKHVESPVAVARCLSDKAEIRYFEPSYIADQARTAARTLEELRSAVREVDAARWPDNHAPAK